MDLMEKVKRPVVEGVCLVLYNGEIVEGALCVTAFHFIFSTRIKAEDETMVSPCDHVISHMTLPLVPTH